MRLDPIAREEVTRSRSSDSMPTHMPTHMHTRSGKYDEAARTLRRGAQIYRSTLGPTHMHTRVALGWLKHAELENSRVDPAPA
jgi:hypothetical protein